MSISTNKYIGIILVHVLIGIVIFMAPFLAKVYGYSIFLGGIYYVIANQNRNDEVLLAAAYVVGSEVLLRMTNGNVVYEFSKYAVMIFIALGVYFSGFSKNALPYWIFMLLLVPGMIIGAYSMDAGESLRKHLSFNISGPACLAFCSLYAYQRSITFESLNKLLLYIGLPIISTTVYLMLYTPSVRDVVIGTGSNMETSGGFGPNQVATILGLGVFVFVARLVFSSQSKIVMLINLVIVLNIGFRGLVTFSRGGMLTAGFMIIVLMGITYFKLNSRGKSKMNFLILGIVVAVFATWSYSSLQTGGLIERRYANEDATGKVKESRFTGREELAEDEINTFLEYPVFGVGVGVNSYLRLKKTGDVIVSHNELTRMLAEHGSLGIASLLILSFTPLILYLDNKSNVFLLCFLVFWLLTINHAAMRLAAPAFVYCLSLLKVTIDEKPVVHRE